MIPEREQHVIKQRLDAGLSGRVRIDYFTQRASPIAIPGRQECRFCGEVEGALQDIAALHDKVSLTVHEFADAGEAAEKLAVKRVPCTVIRGQANRAIRFYGLPGGVQFPIFVETIIMSSQTKVEIEREAALTLKKLRASAQVSVFVTPVCQYSGHVSLAAVRLALANAQVRAEVVEISEFPELVERFGVTATPLTVIDGRVVIRGAMDEVTLAAGVLAASAEAGPLAQAVNAGPFTPFDGHAIEQAARAADPAAPRIYVPGQ
jgi:glutaredoxin-like protein